MKVLSVANPYWNNAQHTVLTCDVLFEELEQEGPLPFTTMENADTDYGVEIWENALAGDYGEISEWVGD